MNNDTMSFSKFERTSEKLIFVNSNMTSFFHFVNKRAIYRWYNLIRTCTVECDWLFHWQHKLCATFSGNCIIMNNDTMSFSKFERTIIKYTSGRYGYHNCQKGLLVVNILWLYKKNMQNFFNLMLKAYYISHTKRKLKIFDPQICTSISRQVLTT
jgi:hypothetical protein